MTEIEAKKLKAGDRVVFMDKLVDDSTKDDNGSLGTVVNHDYSRFMVRWDDGMECSYPHILAMAIQRVVS